MQNHTAPTTNEQITSHCEGEARKFDEVLNRPYLFSPLSQSVCVLSSVHSSDLYSPLFMPMIYRLPTMGDKPLPLIPSLPRLYPRGSPSHSVKSKTSAITGTKPPVEKSYHLIPLHRPTPPSSLSFVIYRPACVRCMRACRMRAARVDSSDAERAWPARAPPRHVTHSTQWQRISATSPTHTHFQRRAKYIPRQLSIIHSLLLLVLHLPNTFLSGPLSYQTLPRNLRDLRKQTKQ